MNYYKIGICDDEEIILENIYKLIQDKFKQINCNFEIIKFKDAKSLIHSNYEESFDIVFLDIDMPEINGIEAAQNIKTNNSNAMIIFITSKDELVYESFKVQPFRFIRKSKLMEEISEAVLELHKLLERNSYKLNIKIDNNNYEINISSILYIESNKNYIIIKTLQDRQFRYKGSINKKEKELEEYGFIRTHTGFLVNQKYIQRINAENVLLKNNEQIPMSRTRKQYVQQKFIEFLR